MKKNLMRCLTGAIVLSMASCKVNTYYQVYKTTTSANVTTKENLLVYEDSNCKVSYNLWSDGGNCGFSIYNKTDKDIRLALAESYFVLNGVANNYFKNRTFGESNSSNLTATHIKSFSGLNLYQNQQFSLAKGVSTTSSTGVFVSYTEEREIVIPSKTSKAVSEYSVANSIYRDCDLLRFPSSKGTIAKTFGKQESPLVFSNRLAYRVGKSEELIKFENEFYVSEVTNLQEDKMFNSATEKFCGEKGMNTIYIAKDSFPNKFYLKYSKEQGSFKH